MTDWVAATGTGSLSREVLAFLRDEVRSRTADDGDSDPLMKVINIKKNWEQFIGTVLADGLPAGRSAPSWQIAEARQRNAETMAWAVMNALALTIAQADNLRNLSRWNGRIRELPFLIF